MKTITETLGGAQELLDISFSLQSCFEEALNDQQRTFLHMMRCIEEHIPILYRPYAGTGRIPYQYGPFIKSQLAKNFFRITTTQMLIERLKADPNLRLLCNFKKVPGKASFSRVFCYLAEIDIMTKIRDKLTAAVLKDKIVYHISRDSTAIQARETVPKKAAKKPPEPPKKRGRPPKTAIKQEKQPKEMEKQLTEDPYVSLNNLNKKCAYGCKQDSRGNRIVWKGYKLHLDVSDWGYPITACVTGANVQDSLLAIPMEKITEQKAASCYSLMDSGYDAKTIRSYIESRERVPIIDYKTRNNGTRQVLDPAKQERYKIRTSVERANSHLKDSLLPKAIYVKGNAKVS